MRSSNGWLFLALATEAEELACGMMVTTGVTVIDGVVFKVAGGITVTTGVGGSTTDDSLSTKSRACTVSIVTGMIWLYLVSPASTTISYVPDGIPENW